MEQERPGFLALIVKTIVVHTTTYFVIGLLAATFLNYGERFARPDMVCWIRQLDDPLVMAGPLFQPVRGLIFALAFYPLRQILFGRRNGWLMLGWLLVALGILSPFGASLGSIEGLIYARVAIADQLIGWLEVVPPALLLATILWYWVNHPEKRWLTWGLGVLFFFVLLLPTVGLFS